MSLELRTSHQKLRCCATCAETPATVRWEAETGRPTEAHRPVGQAYSAEDQPILSSSPHNLTPARHAPMYTHTLK